MLQRLEPLTYAINGVASGLQVTGQTD
jgi:hypothetical protein